MRDKRFVAVHRGGLLTKENHRKLIRWARECSEHVLFLIEGNIDTRLIWALQVAKEWESEHATVGDARKASVGAHATARASYNPVSMAVARSVGHAVATAHMSDHSPGAALYALLAVKIAGKSVDEERVWQIVQLQSGFSPEATEIVELVMTTLMEKEKILKIQ